MPHNNKYLWWSLENIIYQLKGSVIKIVIINLSQSSQNDYKVDNYHWIRIHQWW